MLRLARVAKKPQLYPSAWRIESPPKLFSYLLGWPGRPDVYPSRVPRTEKKYVVGPVHGGHAQQAFVVGVVFAVSAAGPQHCVAVFPHALTSPGSSASP